LIETESYSTSFFMSASDANAPWVEILKQVRLGGEDRSGKVIVLGRCGAGKSSLITALLNVDTAEVRRSSPCYVDPGWKPIKRLDVPLKFYDTTGTEGQEFPALKRDIFRAIARGNRSLIRKHHFPAALLVVSSVGSKWETGDVTVLEELVTEFNLPVGIVVTRVVGQDEEDFVADIKRDVHERLPDCPVFGVNSVEKKMRFGPIPRIGLEELATGLVSLIREGLGRIHAPIEANRRPEVAIRDHRRLVEQCVIDAKAHADSALAQALLAEESLKVVMAQAAKLEGLSRSAGEGAECAVIQAAIFATKLVAQATTASNEARAAAATTATALRTVLELADKVFGLAQTGLAYPSRF
jgi:hypothetical protein